ncbi:MAG: class II aldolase/adducin family protein [candidate division Zixibacteria bacterium]|nr:class II aldolase/adducin family protein [candidate division Zixibacteria bacterium]
MNIWQARKEIVEIGRRCYERGFVAATDGNMSCRVGDNLVAATPAGLCKGNLAADDVVVLDAAGRRVEGHREASSEILLHLEIYKERPDVNGVVHAHPPTATGFAVARMPLAECVLPEVIATFGNVPLAPYATPSTPEVPESIRPKLRDHNAFLLANHGTVTLGATLEEAYFTLEKVEQFARVMLVARQLGRVAVLTRDDVAKLTQIAPGKPPLNIPCDVCEVAEEAGPPEDDAVVREAVRRVLERLGEKER